MSNSPPADRLPHAKPFKTQAEKAMKYLCLIFIDESKYDAMPQNEQDALVAETLAYDETLKKSGHFIVSEALESVKTATTLRVRNGKLSSTDGPYAETKEQLGGFFLINAKDLDEAIQLASKIPCARDGSIELRPIMELKQQRACA
jgi:hypothetical protein